ncbi:MAG: MATE family efflux transporter [Muribaculaceae bacterium]|nr:MATE family efflux transporter [Muribaculaceae bacterium]
MAPKAGTGSGVDMLHGPMAMKILLFSLPLMASGILQQSFNAVDVAVIGHYSTSQAMAAVGSNGVIISILVNLFLGVAVGANVVIANYLGQHNDSGVRRSVATVGIVSIISGIVLLGLGLGLARPILEAMSAPEDVIDLAAEYLRIYFCGMPFIMVYNFGSAILRSIGDTKRPFYSLLVATVVNAVLDWTFVAVFDMGVDGVAIATVIANAVNAAIIVWILMREPEPCTFHPREMGVDRRDLSKMLRIGIPAGLQGMVFSFSNIFIQSSINSYGAQAVAGSAAAVTYEAYCYYIVTAFCAAAIAFTGQNYGAGQSARCKRVFRISMLMAMVGCAAANLLIVWQSKAFISVFTSDPEVYHYALERLHTVLTFQFIAATYEIAGAYMRGLGYSMLPMILTVFGTCVLRLVWVFTVAANYRDFSLLLDIYPISWTITGALVVTAAFIVQRKAFAVHNFGR